jgi:three-Cys-motif partner protein
MTGEDFFQTQRAAAVLKHEVLASYVTIFASKVGSVSPDGRVAYLDGFAGAGRYDDGSAGSPLLLMQRAKAMTYRRLECHFVEQDPVNSASLQRVLQEQDLQGLAWRTYQGSVDTHIDAVLRATTGIPLFAFLDPFGLSVRHDTLMTRLLTRPLGQHGQPATEVLLNFSLRDLRRNVGHLASQKSYAGKETQLERLDRALGGAWWQPEYLDLLEQTGDEEAALGAIIHGYQDRLDLQGWFSLYAPVRNSASAKPIYLLFFMTRSEQGMWFFADRLAAANAAWRLAVERAGVAKALDRGQAVTLFDDDHAFAAQTDADLRARFKSSEAERAEQWVGVIVDNLHRLLARQHQVALAAHVEQVYGRVLTLAGETHVRRAVKRLHAAGVTPTPGTGPLNTMVVVSGLYA